MDTKNLLSGGRHLGAESMPSQTAAGFRRNETSSLRGGSLRLWRLAIIALGTLILCSCRGASVPVARPAAGPGGPSQAAPDATAEGYAALPPQAYSGMPPGGPCPAEPCLAGPPGMEAGVPLPATCCGAWTPPGIVPPWPTDEYLCDGGEAGPPIRPAPERPGGGLGNARHGCAIKRWTAVFPSSRATRSAYIARGSSRCGRSSTWKSISSGTGRRA